VAAATQSHRTSLAVWDVPSTAVAGGRFTIKAGGKSSADCDLRGCRIEVRDAAGAVIGEGRLGETPWPDTRALYWTELSLPAPKTEGFATLSVRLQAKGIEPPHADAVSQFRLAIVRAPDHTLTVRIVEEAGMPIEGADIRLGPYRATTGRSGLATLRVCKGGYDLHIWKVGYEAPPRSLDIGADSLVEVAAVTMPEENADRAWKM